MPQPPPQPDRLPHGGIPPVGPPRLSPWQLISTLDTHEQQLKQMAAWARQMNERMRLLEEAIAQVRAGESKLGELQRQITDWRKALQSQQGTDWQQSQEILKQRKQIDSLTALLEEKARAIARKDKAVGKSSKAALIGALVGLGGIYLSAVVVVELFTERSFPDWAVTGGAVGFFGAAGAVALGKEDLLVKAVEKHLGLEDTKEERSP